MCAIWEAVMPCPEEISVIGFDQFVWTANYSPKLLTLAQPAYEIGKVALEILLPKMAADSEEAVGPK